MAAAPRGASSTAITKGRHARAENLTVPSGLDWRSYEGRVEASLLAVGYAVLKSDSQSLVCARYVPGDAYRLRIEEGGPPANLVAVTFTASPD